MEVAEEDREKRAHNFPIGEPPHRSQNNNFDEVEEHNRGASGPYLTPNLPADHYPASSSFHARQSSSSSSSPSPSPSPPSPPLSPHHSPHLHNSSSMSPKPSTSPMHNAALAEIPVFTEHPQKAIHAHAGETVVLRCAVDCVPSPPIYQWFYNQTPLVGEKAPQLVLKNIHHGHKGLYCCRATNPHINNEKTKHVFSNFAELSINQYPIQGSLIQRHIQQQGRLNTVCSVKMLLCGPPETGKTTTMRRLTNQIDCLDPSAPQVPSTVLDKPRTVQLLHKSSVLIADQKKWSFEETIKEQGCSLYSLILNDTSNTATNTSSADHLDQHTTYEDEVTMTTSSKQVHVDQEMMDAKEVPQLAEPEDWEEVIQLAEAKDWEEVTKKLSKVKNATILHVIDSGGQPECHEILPLLLDGQIVSLIFLDLTKKLGDKHPVFFRSENNVKNPIGEFTTGEVLKRILSSISSLQSDSHRSIALLVGTHLDKATDEIVHDLDEAVQSSFKSFIENGFICSARIKGEQPTHKYKYITTINNMTKDHGDIERLRTLILQVIDEEFRQKQDRGIPTGWLLLHLLLRHKYQDRGWCTKEECAPIAKLCGIKVVEKGEEKEGEDDELAQVLHAIHENYGTILYFSCLPNLVICDPNVILWPLKSVFEFVFVCCSTKHHIANHIRNTGAVPKKVLEDYFKTGNLEFSTIVKLFKHRLILCEAVEGEGEYFMPCLLRSSHAVAKEVSKPQDLASLNPAPILFVPHSKSCYDSPSPLGVFSALVVDMSTKSEWVCTGNDRYRDQMQFNVKHKDSRKRYIVELRHHATYIELRLIRGDKIPHILATFQQQLLRSLEGLSEKYTHMNGITWELGFFCPGSLVEGGHPHPALVEKNMSTEDMECTFKPRCHDRISDLEEKHLCWFEEHDLSKKDTPDGNKHKLPQVPNPHSTSATRTSAVLPSGGPLSGRPKMNDFLNQVASKALNKWEEIGIQLGIEKHQLDAIKIVKLGDPMKCYMEVFSLWENNAEPPFTWTTVIDALKAPMVGKVRLAQDIEVLLRRC